VGQQENSDESITRGYNNFVHMLIKNDHSWNIITSFAVAVIKSKETLEKIRQNTRRMLE